VIVVAAAVAAAAGVGIGYLLGNSGDEEVSAASVESSMRAELGAVANGLALLPNEYRQAYSGSGRESLGVEGVVTRIRTGVDNVRSDLETLDPDDLETLDDRIEELANAVGSRQPPARIEALAARVKAALESVPGGG
jgi:hypothetical protein